MIGLINIKNKDLKIFLKYKKKIPYEQNMTRNLLYN